MSAYFNEYPICPSTPFCSCYPTNIQQCELLTVGYAPELNHAHDEPELVVWLLSLTSLQKLTGHNTGFKVLYSQTSKNVEEHMTFL